jgi:hypothetical protein
MNAAAFVAVLLDAGLIATLPSASSSSSSSSTIVHDEIRHIMSSQVNHAATIIQAMTRGSFVRSGVSGSYNEALDRLVDSFMDEHHGAYLEDGAEAVAAAAVEPPQDEEVAHKTFIEKEADDDSSRLAHHTNTLTQRVTNATRSTATTTSMSRLHQKQMREVAVAEKALRTSSSRGAGGTPLVAAGRPDPPPIRASFCDFVEALVRWTYATRGWGVAAEHRTDESFANLLRITIESLVVALRVGSWPEIEQRSHDDHLAFLRQIALLEKGGRG